MSSAIDADNPTDWRGLSERLRAALKPFAPPIAIQFHFGSHPEAKSFGGTYPPPNDAGRTGAVPAGCVFWVEAARRQFSTVAGDHANCSVGSYTHGFLDLATAAKGDDVAAALGAGWINEAAFSALPVVKQPPFERDLGPAERSDRR